MVSGVAWAVKEYEMSLVAVMFLMPSAPARSLLAGAQSAAPALMKVTRSYASAVNLAPATEVLGARVNLVALPEEANIGITVAASETRRVILSYLA